jgi:probable rRNA maturation factor
MAKVSFYQHEVNCNLRERITLKLFLINLFKKERKGLTELTYIFCSDEYLLTINQQSLNHNFYTDIITFDLSETKEQTIGEIYISLERVKENATTHQATFTNELHRVIFHGALHLCGYKDKSKAEIALMRSREEYYLKRYFS